MGDLSPYTLTHQRRIYFLRAAACPATMSLDHAPASSMLSSAATPTNSSESRPTGAGQEERDVLGALEVQEARAVW